MYDGLLSTQDRVMNNLVILNQNQQIGMLSSKYCITDEKQAYQKLLPEINHELLKLGYQNVQKVNFVARQSSFRLFFCHNKVRCKAFLCIFAPS